MRIIESNGNPRTKPALEHTAVELVSETRSIVGEIKADLLTQLACSLASNQNRGSHGRNSPHSRERQRREEACGNSERDAHGPTSVPKRS